MTPLQILGLFFAAALGIAIAVWKRYYHLPMSSYDTIPPDESFIPASVPPVQAPKQPVTVSKAQTLYSLAKEALGSHLTLNQNVPEEEGCAEAVSVLLERCGYPIPQEGIPSVNGLIDFMLAQGFQEVKEGTPGCVITAHNPDPSVPTAAHVGIVMEYGVASNDSRPAFLGKFWENYLDGTKHWEAYFTANGSVTRFFLPV